MNQFLALLIFCFSSLALAEGGTLGGGGQGVRCGERVELLDLYEAEHLHGQTPILNASNNLQDYIDEAQKNFQEFFPSEKWLFSAFPLAKSYANSQNIIFQEAPLEMIKDWGSLKLTIPTSCQLVQLATFHDGKVTVDFQLWNRLSNLHKAALLLHESLHTHLNFNSKNSAGETLSDNYGIRWVIMYMTASRKFRSQNADEMNLILNHFYLYGTQSYPKDRLPDPGDMRGESLSEICASPVLSEAQLKLCQNIFP